MLPEPSKFYPWTTGVYSVKPGLHPLGTDFGNGDADARLMLLDSDFSRYRENKEGCATERRSKYWQQRDISPEVVLAAFQAIGSCLGQDYPEYFEFREDILVSQLTGERVAICPDGKIDRNRSELRDGIEDTLEALAFQIQSDLAVVVRRPDGSDENVAIHLSAPSHWAAEDKVGRSFFETHTPVPEFEAVNRAASRLVQSIVQMGPFVRFVWGVESDDRLNHHPVAPLGVDQDQWWGRQFDRGQFWVRTERQSLLGLPDVDAALFFIHPQTIPSSVLLARDDLRSPLVAALNSMSPSAREYKGVAPKFDALLALLQPST